MRMFLTQLSSQARELVLDQHSKPGRPYTASNQSCKVQVDFIVPSSPLLRTSQQGLVQSVSNQRYLFAHLRPNIHDAAPPLAQATGPCARTRDLLRAMESAAADAGVVAGAARRRSPEDRARSLWLRSTCGVRERKARFSATDRTRIRRIPRVEVRDTDLGSDLVQSRRIVDPCRQWAQRTCHPRA
jgi:hypothetical protein